MVTPCQGADMFVCRFYAPPRRGPRRTPKARRTRATGARLAASRILENRPRELELVRLQWHWCRTANMPRKQAVARGRACRPCRCQNACNPRTLEATFVESAWSPVRATDCRRTEERMPKSIGRAFTSNEKRDTPLACLLLHRQNDLALRTRCQKFLPLARLF